jgi:hypothetical protein
MSKIWRFENRFPHNINMMTLCNFFQENAFGPLNVHFFGCEMAKFSQKKKKKHITYRAPSLISEALQDFSLCI